jgi:hypothetical protein
LKYLIHLEGCGHTAERLHAEIVTGKIALDESKRAATDDDRIRGRQTLESGRNIRRFPQRQLFSSAAAEFAHHDQPGVDTHGLTPVAL